MIFFDVTKLRSASHRSGLARLSERLRSELGAAATSGSWTEVRERATRDDWFVTSELFSEQERPGLQAFLRSGRCRTAAIFADAIPLKLPQITWPQSVARHPHYLKMLADFQRVWAISEASRDELLSYWHWLDLDRKPSVDVLPLGADFDGTPRVTRRSEQGAAGPPALLCVGILEPRKNQTFLLDVCTALWEEGLSFELHVVGRVNPHFGRPIVARLKTLRRKFPGLHYHEAATDAVLARLYARACATVYPTLAEGCGLPLLESMWRGVPVVCSDLPVLRENALGGGCLPVRLNDPVAWKTALRQMLERGSVHARLAEEAVTRPLPTWGQAAALLRDALT